MGKRKRRSGSSGHGGHYCKICGEWKANERFSGRGHARHICKDCARMPAEQREAIILIDRIIGLPLHLSKERLAWLDGLRSDSRPAVRELAETTYAIRTNPRLLRLYAMSDGAEWPEDEEWLDEEP